MQFCCSLSRVVVSPGPLSGPLKEREEVGGGGGLLAPAATLAVDAEVWERAAWLLGG